MKDVNTCAQAIAETAQAIVTAPQLFIVIVLDPTIASYRSNYVGGMAKLPALLRELADKMEAMGVIDLNAPLKPSSGPVS